MKITFVGHASILIETSGIRILSDPWWRGPCFGAQWWNYPLPHLDPVKERQPDFIYISHGHHDHLHPSTLGTLGKTAKILVAGRTGLASHISAQGYDVIAVDDNAPITLADGKVRCRILQTHGDDTLMSVDDGEEVCVNINDALHSAPGVTQRDFIARLKALHDTIDYVFCGYGVASHFPNCYVIPGKNNIATAKRRQQYFNRQWAKLIAGIGPRYGLPFAADVALLEQDLFWVNEVTHNAERPTEAFRRLYPDSSVNVIDIAPGFVIENGKIVANVLRQPVLAHDIQRSCAEQVERANRVTRIRDEDLEAVVELLGHQLRRRREYLSTYEGDYRFLIRFPGARRALRIEKQGQQLLLTATDGIDAHDADIVYTTRLAYLKWALTRPYGDEILFVGSGGIFRYARQSQARKNLHRELIALLRSVEPTARRAPQPVVWRRIKEAAKRLLGRSDRDLYDLGDWTVFDVEA